MSFCSTKNTNISTNQIMMEIAHITTNSLCTHKSRQISPTNISFSVFPKSWFIVFSIPDPPQNLELSKLDHNSVQMKVSLNSIKWNYKTSDTFIEYLFLTTIIDMNWFWLANCTNNLFSISGNLVSTEASRNISSPRFQSNQS